MPDALLLVVLTLGVVFLAAIFILLWRLHASAGPRLDASALSAYVTASLQQSGFAQDLGAVKHLANEMNQASRDLTRLFETRTLRGSLGEQQLEEILADVVPPDRLFIRRNLPLVGTPDAAIRTRAGLVCIDSKFPLDAYRDAATGDGAAKEQRARDFQRAVRAHLEKVATAYVRPDAGTTAFALAFIPSEAVYTYLHQTDPTLGRAWAQRGVLLASPSTLTTHVALIVAGVRAEVLGERIDLVQDSIRRLDREFQVVRRAWDTLRRHVRHAADQAGEVESAFAALEGAYRVAANLEVGAPIAEAALVEAR